MKEVIVKHIEPVHEDERGIIMDILEDETILHIGLITSKKGCIRGNHYHNKQINKHGWKIGAIVPYKIKRKNGFDNKMPKIPKNTE